VLSLERRGLVLMKPALWDLIKSDGYFTPLCYYKHDDSGSKAPYGPAYRRQRGLKSLNACFVDLDFYQKGMSFKSVWKEVQRRIRKKIFPKPSMIADSGSGMWLFWLLHDENDRKRPPKGDPKYYATNFQLWRKIQEELIVRLKDLGADPLVKDGARLTRVPGS